MGGRQRGGEAGRGVRATQAGRLRRALVAALEGRGHIRSPAVRKAFAAVPRELFVPEVAEREGMERVYSDAALVTRTDTRGMPLSSSSQPTIMAEMLEHLDLRPGLRVLEIGTGTGYNAALLSLLVGETGEVTSIELEADLADRASEALAAGGYRVDVVTGDAVDAVDGTRSYDRILVTASSGHVPRAWTEALVDGGLLELPLRLPGSKRGDQVVVTLRKEGDGLRSVALVPGGFMTLRRGGGAEEPAPNPPASVSVSEFVDGAARSLASVSGAGIATMRPRARRRLAALMLSEPRVRRLATPGAAGSSLVAWLAMAEPPAGVTVQTFRPGKKGPQVGSGVVAKDGHSLALALGGLGRRGCRIEAYGDDPAAEQSLDRLIGRWRAAGCPALSDCEITVSYGTRPPALGAGVEVAGHGGSWTTLRWPS